MQFLPGIHQKIKQIELKFLTLRKRKVKEIVKMKQVKQLSLKIYKQKGQHGPVNAMAYAPGILR